MPLMLEGAFVAFEVARPSGMWHELLSSLHACLGAAGRWRPAD